MNDSVARAIENHQKGYNCAQAVFCAFCAECGISEETAFAISEGFGGGIGGTHRSICGALSGMIMAISKSAGASAEDPRKGRRETYGAVQELLREFEEKNGSIICGELLGAAGAPKLRSCAGCVEDAAVLAAGYFSRLKEDSNGD